MDRKLTQRIDEALASISLIDPHTHIDPHQPTARTLADILGYHYYTELAHSAGLPRETIEDPKLSPRERVGRLVPYLEHLDNTVQVSWLLEMARTLFGFDEPAITTRNWEKLYDLAEEKLAADDWEWQVLETSRLEKVFLTNAFDDPLHGWDTNAYVPCLRTDDLVFHLDRREIRDRLCQAANVEVIDAGSLSSALGKLFQHFTAHDARACAISLPPDFEPAPVSDGEVETALGRVLAGREVTSGARCRVSAYVFWAIVELCDQFRLPFDLMIGVNRGVYQGGVYQGQDLFDSRTSLYQYRRLFNSFPRVTFPVSVLPSTLSHELVSYSWIFPNVVCFGHWWYSNVPAYIENDTRARLQAVPRTKQIGYYSDMYKLEFALPKFNMYRRTLARVLADDFVYGRGWTDEQAVELGRQVLRGNVERVFFADEQAGAGQRLSSKREHRK